MSKARRAFFHWQYSQVFIGIVFTVGTGLMFSSRYVFACFAYLIAGGWSLAYWFHSDFLYERNRRLRKFRAKRHALVYGKIYRKIRVTKWAVAGVVMAITLFCCGYSLHLKIDDASRDVAQHLDAVLSLPQGSSEMNSQFTVRNNSGESVYLANIECHVRDIIFKSGYEFYEERYSPWSTDDNKVPLEPYGQGAYSFSCPVENGLMSFAVDNPLVCGDTEWTVTYRVDGFAFKNAIKQYRFILLPGDQVWSPSPLNEPAINCKDMINARQKQ